MRARLTAVVGLAALVMSCAPTDSQLGVTQDVAGDELLLVASSSGWPEHHRVQMTMRPGGSFLAVIESSHPNDKSCSFSGSLGAASWQTAITALGDAKFWWAAQKSRAFHTVRPNTPNGAKLVYALPEGSPHYDQGTIEIDWRRADGKRKYVADTENPRTYEGMYDQLFAAMKFNDLKCPDEAKGDLK